MKSPPSLKEPILFGGDLPISSFERIQKVMPSSSRAPVQRYERVLCGMRRVHGP